jgi:Methyltransferase domain
VYGHASRSRLNKHDLPRFPGETLFDRVAQVLCEAECLPRKELFESWEVAKRAARKLRGRRVVDLCCGHALVGQLMLLLVPSLEEVLAVDKRLPLSATKVTRALAAKWPRLRDRVTLREARLDEVSVASDDVLVSCHGCGVLTDRVLDRAIEAAVPVAVLPCCQATALGDAGGLSGWLEPALAIDVTRAARLRSHGFRVSTQHIPETVTAKNRLLIGQPRAAERTSQ